MQQRSLRISLFLALILLLGAIPALAQQSIVRVEGTVLDLDGDPVVMARVVYRVVDSEDVYLSDATNAKGGYTVDLAAGLRCFPTAVLLGDGTRVELGTVAPSPAADGMSQRVTIELPKRWNPSAVVQNFSGSDRLYRSFVEDTAIVDRFRVETQLQRQDGDSVDRGLLNIVGAAQFSAIPEVEFGARISLVGVDVDGGPGGEGIGDTDLWVKYVLGATKDNRHELAFGAKLTVATGDADEGTGLDSDRSKLFVAARREVSWGVLTGNLGLQLNGDGALFGSTLDGKTALSVNAGAIVPWTHGIAFITELGFEGKRFESGEDDTSILGGVNVLLKEGSLRAALALGLSDGAPDTEITVGYAFQF